MCACSLGVVSGWRVKATNIVCSVPVPKYSLWWLSTTGLGFWSDLVSERPGAASWLVFASGRSWRWKSSSKAEKHGGSPKWTGREKRDQETVQKECGLQLKRKNCDYHLSPLQQLVLAGLAAISMSASQGIPKVLCKLHSYTKYIQGLLHPSLKRIRS